MYYCTSERRLVFEIGEGDSDIFENLVVVDICRDVVGMDRSNSMIGEEDVLSRCRERKRFMKLAIENRYALATALVKYIQSLKHMGIGLRFFAEGEMMSEYFHSTSPRGVFEPPIYFLEKSSSPSIVPFSSPSTCLPQTPRSEIEKYPSPLDNSSSHGIISSSSYASPSECIT